MEYISFEVRAKFRSALVMGSEGRKASGLGFEGMRLSMIRIMISLGRVPGGGRGGVCCSDILLDLILKLGDGGRDVF